MLCGFDLMLIFFVPIIAGRSLKLLITSFPRVSVLQGEMPPLPGTKPATASSKKSGSQ